MSSQPAHADGGAAEQAPAGQDPSALSERDLAMLDFERRWWRHAGAKEEAIRAQFGLTAARYYQLLNILVDSPEAVRADPMLVRRLQRTRDSRIQARSSRMFGTPDRGADDRRPTAAKPE